MNYADSVTQLIGATPLLKLHKISPDAKVNIFAKLEYLNPGGSIKDRIGLQIIEDAQKTGQLKPGDTIVEATAGNTGIGLSIAALDRGYKMKIVIPQKFSIEKQILMRALGAEQVITPTEDGIEGAVEKAEEIVRTTPNCFMARQFENQSNVKAHRRTGQEIYDALDGQVDILVAGAGSGGTITGIAQYLKEKNKDIKIVLADPIGSILGGGESGTYKVEGIGNHFIPHTFDPNLIDEVEKIPDDESMYYVRLLAKREGVLVGSSSGAAIAGAIKQAYKTKKPTNIAVVFPDGSDRYFSQHLYDFDLELSDFRCNALFDDYAQHYDRIVAENAEYKKLYENYNEILNETVKHLARFEGAKVIDIGAGTGNLTDVADRAGYDVIGIEPNRNTREIARKKFPHLTFSAGAFLSLPIDDGSLDGIISSYAFHNLTDREKEEAVQVFRKKLKSDGIIVIADIVYESEASKAYLTTELKTQGEKVLYQELISNTAATQSVLTSIFTSNGFEVSYQQLNKFVWIVTAKKAEIQA
ncbi:MAG: pyridoxal-phosphate dependent enzyme [Lachnospiraceae bacterium]